MRKPALCCMRCGCRLPPPYRYCMKWVDCNGEPVADVTADAVPEENNAGVQPDSPADTEAETLADLSEQAVFGASGDNGAFLQYLLAEGLLTESVYQAWMLEQGYDDPSDWTREELCGAFGLAAE